jgi:hypothetical protein
MNYVEFAQNVIEQIVASIPEITLIATTLIYGIKMLKAKTQEFPDLLIKTENKMNHDFTETRISVSREVTRLGQELSEKVNGSLLDMKKELSTYDNNQQAMSTEFHALVEENRAIIDMLIKVSGQDVRAIRDGVHKIISERADNRKKEV